MLPYTLLSGLLAFAGTSITTLAIQGRGDPVKAENDRRVAKPKLICRHDASTGSILPKRVCKTAQDWALIDAANRNAVDQMDQQQMNSGRH